MPDDESYTNRLLLNQSLTKFVYILMLYAKGKSKAMKITNNVMICLANNLSIDPVLWLSPILYIHSISRSIFVMDLVVTCIYWPVNKVQYYIILL